MQNSSVEITSSTLGTPLQSLLCADSIEPGSDASYQLCKLIYLYHPLGARIVETPIEVAMSQQREISVPTGPEGMINEAFFKAWAAMDIDKAIFSVMAQSRVYGIASLGMIVEGEQSADPLDIAKLVGKSVKFNVMDPLNTAGSLVMIQDPNLADYQKPTTIEVQGTKYHSSRCCIVMNESPIYISYTSSAFGFVGRSAYQRALFPLKSFIQSMQTDDLVSLKSGLIIAKIKSPGSIIDNIMLKISAVKRALLKSGQTGNVLQIGVDEEIETLNMMNTDTAMTTARKNILENIATSVPMPATMLNSETFVEGFGEGTEDAKKEARFVDGMRKKMQPVYDFFDPIVQQKAWDKGFFERVQAMHPEEYGDISYEVAYRSWCNSFVATWPSLLTEPESELCKTDDVKLKAIIAALEVLMPELDPENKGNLLDWAQQNINENKILFKEPMLLDIEAFKKYVPPEPEPGAVDGETEPKPFAAAA